MALNITRENFEKEVTQASRPVIIDIFAPWCGVCMQMEPIFEAAEHELADQYVFAKINIEHEQELATEKYNVQSVPTFVLIKNGSVVKQLHGYMPESEFITAIREALE